MNKILKICIALILMNLFAGCYSPPTIEDQIKGYCLEKGLIEYSVPKFLKVGKGDRIVVKIKKDFKSEIQKMVLIGDKTERIFEKRKHFEREKYYNDAESIRISTATKIDVIAPESETFEITRLTEEWQMVDSLDYTYWEWNIKAKGVGEYPIGIYVTSKIFDGISSNVEQVKVFEKEIIIKSDVTYYFLSFWDKYWQWLISVILIPILLWTRKYILDKRKKLIEEKNKRPIGFK